MFNIGTGEMIMIAVVALLVLGPARLPELARGIGKFIREFRRQTDDVRNVVEREFYRMDQDINTNAPPAQMAPQVVPPPESVPQSTSPGGDAGPSETAQIPVPAHLEPTQQLPVFTENAEAAQPPVPAHLEATQQLPVVNENEPAHGEEKPADGTLPSANIGKVG